MNPWKRKVVIGNATLYLGDCLEILPHLPKVDAVITDPPFNAGKEFANDSMTVVEWVDFCCRVGDALLTVTPTNLLIEVGKNDSEMKRALDARFRYRWVLALHYTNAMRQGAVGGADFGMVLWYGEKCFRRYKDLISAPLLDTTREFRHPSPKVVAHYRRLVEMFSPIGGLVCDPFIGSGTTGVACMNLGRKFIGIEIEPKYFDIACERIENAQRQQRMFA